MAEITSPAAAGSKPGGRRGKKLSTRVDLTPMVDLGFLLITFFIFTTTMSQPSAMKLVMPKDGPVMPVKESGSLTVVPFSNNRIFYFHGELDKALSIGDYGISSYSFADGIGQVIRNKQEAMDKAKPGSRNDLMLIIKPLGSSNLQNVVDIIDEVKINDVESYALTDISDVERVMLKGKAE